RLVSAAGGDGGQTRVLVEAAVAVERVPDTGDDVVHRVPDVGVPGHRVRVERGVDALHQTLRRGALGGVGVPIVDRARVATRLVLDDRPDLVDVLLGDRDSVLLQDLDGFLDPLLDVARRRPRRRAATRTETAAARRGRDVAAATTAPAAAAADARCAAAAA